MSDISAFGTNSYFSNSYQNTGDADTVKLKSKIEDLDSKKSSDKELIEVCKEFETYFVEQMVKSMEKTVDVFSAEDESSNSYMNYFGDYLYQGYASNIVDSGELGIAQMLYESMKR